jgi:hypothetical protein
LTNAELQLIAGDKGWQVCQHNSFGFAVLGLMGNDLGHFRPRVYDQ